ncbi:sulfite exporter TauE/SafE family protein [Variovorax sp. LARHSF232]
MMLEQAPLIGAALLMGLAGGPHCVAMCGAPSTGLIRLVRVVPNDAAGACARAAPSGLALFHTGRLVSYALAGALVAGVAQALALAAEQVAALSPLWVLLHAAILAWGLALLALGRQPAWAHGLGRALARRLASHGTSGAGRRLLAGGALWVLMPCGLLYSALALASLGNGPLQGGLAMLAFALGSGAALSLAPWLWQRLHARLPRGEGWGTRAAGLLLALLALDALWMDLGRQVAQWCA